MLLEVMVRCTLEDGTCKLINEDCEVVSTDSGPSSDLFEDR